MKCRDTDKNTDTLCHYPSSASHHRPGADGEAAHPYSPIVRPRPDGGHDAGFKNLGALDAARIRNRAEM
jgi:hypothetical protein